MSGEKRICISEAHLDTLEGPEPIIIGVIGKGHNPEVVEALRGVIGVKVLICDEMADMCEIVKRSEIPSLREIILHNPKRFDFSEMISSEPVKGKHYHNSPTFKRRDFKKKR